MSESCLINKVCFNHFSTPVFCKSLFYNRLCKAPSRTIKLNSGQTLQTRRIKQPVLFNTFRNRAKVLDFIGLQPLTVFVYSHKFTAKAANSEPHPPLQSKRLLDQMRERLRYMHYSLNTEKTYLYWVRWFIRFSGLRHPREMGRPEVEAFLTMLANERRAAPSTHRQAPPCVRIVVAPIEAKTWGRR